MTHGCPRSCPPLLLTRAQDSPRSLASVMKAVTGWEASRFTSSPAGGFMKVSHPAQRSLHSPAYTPSPACSLCGMLPPWVGRLSPPRSCPKTVQLLGVVLPLVCLGRYFLPVNMVKHRNIHL